MILDILQKHNVVSKDHATATPLTGGVSCEIYLVEDDKSRLVVKRALAKLKVEKDWFADTSRNLYEQRYLKYVGERYPEYVPKILHSFEQECLFTMEYFPEHFKDWKKYLMKQEVNMLVAQGIGGALANVHSVSWHDEGVAKLFDSDKNFYQLRLEPYFESMIEQHPDLKTQLQSLCLSVSTTKQCLVHGDFSPKNILVSERDIKIVDCEVAWYGDPAFDVAFMLHHLFLKAVHFDQSYYIDAALMFLEQYQSSLGAEKYQIVDEAKIAKLTAAMMLARIDGKSPVEYLSEDNKISIRERVIPLLKVPFKGVNELLRQLNLRRSGA
ncbi:phosphotransferase [Vibrio sp. FNV 38]|nr:phosphotransferase [Vibrio sp. FNV 38]